MSSHSFRIPASTSNLGAGFDALSLALGCHLTVSIEEALEFAIEARGVNADSIPTGPNNLIFKVAKSVAAQRGRTLPPFRMIIENQIPLVRGLGSSAAAIIAGITCYEVLWQDRLANDEIFRYAFPFESHPDNLAAALYGGLISAASSANGAVNVAKLDVAAGVTPVVVIPDFRLSTQRARGVLPKTYSREDAVYNVQRSALTVAVLMTGKWEMLREAMRDRMHEPYRAPLIPGLEQILRLELPGLLGIALSGAGPSVLAFAKPEHADAVGRAVAEVFATHGAKAEPHIFDFDNRGRVIES